MKKYLTAAALIGVIGFAGISMANPQGNYGYGNCGGPSYCDNWSYSEKDDAKSSAFFEETKELRKQIVVKRSELDALMQQENPDEKKVAGLTGELYDLRTLMQEKAGKTFEGRAGYGYGPGYGNCGGGRRGW
jgi:hypothetical protein